jgi:hypothetical protein
MASMDLGDRVVWLGALDSMGNPKGGWAGNGKGRILNFEPTRRYFEGGPRQEANQPPVGPAVMILLDGGDESAAKKYEVWVRPLASEIVPDPDFQEKAA